MISNRADRMQHEFIYGPFFFLAFPGRTKMHEKRVTSEVLHRCRAGDLSGPKRAT